MGSIIQLRRDTAINWHTVNPKLAEGEIGYETDTRKFKFGDGINFWNDLPYSALTQEQADFAETNNTLVTFIKNKPDLSTFHAQGTDTTLGTMTADINMNTHKVKNLSVPTTNGDSIRATTKITEAHLETVYDNTHVHSNATALNAVSGTNTGDNAVNSLYSGLVSNATHIGEVTGSTALTADKTIITNKTLVTPVKDDKLLISDNSDSGNLKQVTAQGIADLAPQGDVIGPASNTADYLPQWNGANSKTLKDGVVIPAGGLAGLTELNLKSSLWTLVPGTPTRSDNTTFTVTDTSNTLKLDLLLSRLTCIKWTESATLRQAMITGAVYGTNTVTITIIGDTLTSIDALSMKYFAQKASFYKFVIAGNVGTTGTNLMNTVMCEVAGKIYGCDAYAGTAGSGTTTFDINKNGTTMYTSKPSITTTTKSVLGKTADTGTVTAVGDFLTVDIDAVAATNIIDAYIYQYYLPLYNTYLA